MRASIPSRAASRRPSRALAALPLLALLAAACGAPARTGAYEAPVPASRSTASSYTIVTSGELADFERGRSLYDALRHLRPLLLQPQGTSFGRTAGGAPMVYLDGVRMGDVGSLASLPASQVVEVRFLRPSEARIRLGPEHGAGAIMVRTRGSPR
jgi:hypothetical protein